MSEIVVVGDVHEGINFGYGIDVETGISARAMDIHGNFARTARYAVDKKAGLFVVVGDLFDRCHVAPVFREMVRRDIISPLVESGIPVWIIAGNHDQPRMFKRGTSLDDFKGFPDVKVFRKPAVESIEIDGRRIGCVLVPYLHPDQIAEMVAEKKGDDIPREQRFVQGQRMLKEFIRRKMEKVEGERKLLFAHYYMEGAKIRESYHPEVLPGEFSFTRDMIPDGADLAVFGHIHLHQRMALPRGEAVYTGSVERIDWGERRDEKGFLVLEPFGGNGVDWRFEALPAREMLEIKSDVSGSSEPTKDILQTIPEDVAGKLVRVEIGFKEGQKSRILENEVIGRLKNAFNYSVNWKEMSEEKAGFVEFTLNPYSLLESFVGINYGGHEMREELLGEGKKILKEVLL